MDAYSTKRFLHLKREKPGYFEIFWEDFPLPAMNFKLATVTLDGLVEESNVCPRLPLSLSES